MKKFLIFLTAFYIGIIIFSPKENLYFTLQKYLKEQNIYINSDIKSNLFSLNLKNAKVFVNKINLINFKKASFYPFIFFNKITVNDIDINVQDLNIKKLNVVYSVIKPLKIKIVGESNFGKIDGFIDLTKQYLKVYIKNPKKIISFLRKDKKGYYFYEKF